MSDGLDDAAKDEAGRTQVRDVIPVSDEFDFSKYQPGDVICISMHEVERLGQAKSILLVAAIANAATRAGLDWATKRCDATRELRVTFS